MSILCKLGLHKPDMDNFQVFNVYGDAHTNCLRCGNFISVDATEVEEHIFVEAMGKFLDDYFPRGEKK